MTGDDRKHGGSTGVPSLVVAIATFKRPERLGPTLHLVAEQIAALVRASRIASGDILVVDNDAAETGRQVVEVGSFATPVRYVVEVKPGIPCVRNRALDESADLDLLVFIDDDEVPLEGWLASLVDTWQRFGQPAAVMGRVVSIFAEDVDPWVLESGLFHRPRRETGAELEAAATGNLLLDLHQVRSLGVRFDERIGLGGGSDTMFSKSLKLKGARLIWCNESIAEDVVELDRQTRRWALKRAYSHGNVAVLVKIRLQPTPAQRLVERLRGVAGGLARMLVGSLRTVFGRATRSVRHDARGRRLASRGAGMLAASTGRAYSAYSRPSAPVGA